MDDKVDSYSSNMDAPAPAPAKQAPRRRPKDRKQQIIATARELFVERGYANAPMALIAERVGITTGALYRHFDSKQLLFEAVIAESFAHLDDPIVSTQLGAVVDEAIETLIGHPYLADLWTSEARYLPEDALAELRRRFRKRVHAFERPLLNERPSLDRGQIELLVWGMQSVFAFLGSATTRTPTAARRPVVRSAALALARAPLSPSEKPTVKHAPVLSPASTRERLLLAAIEQFSEHGFVDTAMSSIGAAVDVTGPNLYGYFDSKVDLLRAVHERGMHALWLNLDTALREADTAEAALDALIAGHVRLSSTWAQGRIDQVGHPELADSLRQTQREYVAEWVGLLKLVDPELDSREARMRVLIALKVMNDLHRTPHVAELASFPRNLASVAREIVRSR